MPSASLLDISILVTPATPEWPGDTPFSCLWTWDMQQGASVNVSATTSSPHVGTHADTPLHVTPGGAASESLSLDALSGPTVVLDVSDLRGEIALADIERRLAPWTTSDVPERILLRTGRTIATGTFPDEWPALAPDCARELARRGLRALGVDCPSVDDRESRTLDVHHALLDVGVCVLENLDLRNADAGTYVLTALPMRVAGLDAAPVRAVLTR